MTIEKYALNSIINDTIEEVNEEHVSDSNVKVSYVGIANAGKSVKPVMVTYSFEPHNTS